MKLRKWLTSILAAGAMATAGSASAIVIGGIDFSNQGTVSHLETTTISETLVLNAGDTLEGYGQVNTVNGLTGTDYCAADANCRLFFYFTYNTTAFSGIAAAFDQGLVTVYYDPNGALRNLQDFSSPENVAYITSLATVWVELTGHAFNSPICGALAGDPAPELCAIAVQQDVNAAFTGAGLLDVVLGSGVAGVAEYLDGNSEGDGFGGFADIAMTTSGSNSVTNQNDVCTGEAGQWCIEGSADLRGQTNLVPEPGTLLLMGFGLLGLLGAGAVARRRRF